MGDDMTPTGSDVVQNGVRGLGDFFRQLGGIAVGGISRKVDLELTRDARQPDTTEVVRAIETPVSPPGFASVIENLTPGQWIGLGVAAGLGWALATGKFR